MTYCIDCGSSGLGVMGSLGTKAYARCRDCGTVQSVPLSDFSVDEECREAYAERIGYADPRDEGAECFEEDDF